MAATGAQPNEPDDRTYLDILESEGTLAPFKKNSTLLQISEALQELHRRETSQQNTTSETIKTILKNRKARLQRMIAYIDVETSPRRLKGEFISDLVDDFSNHIKAVISVLPTSVYKGKLVCDYIGNWEVVKQSFEKAKSDLDKALDAFEAIKRIEGTEKEGNRRTNKILDEKARLYTALRAATEKFEAGLEKWDVGLQESDIKKEKLPQYLHDAYQRLQGKVKSIEVEIYYPLLSVGSKIVSEGELDHFEDLLRKALKTLLEIARTSLPDDEKLQKDIINAKIHHYITDNDGMINNARLAKIALNLALDRYDLIKDLRPLKRDDLNKNLEDCKKSLDSIIQTWKTWENMP